MSKILRADDKFTFGRYKGRTVGDILKANPSYVKWALDHVSWFNVDSSIHRLLRDPKRTSMPWDEFLAL